MRPLLSAQEVIHLLGLDRAGLKEPKEALRNLRRTRRLKYVRVGRRIFYREQDIEQFVNENLNGNGADN